MRALLLLFLIVVGACLWLFGNARAMPVVRRMEIALPFPKDAPRKPVTIALMTDTHLSGPDNSPERMARIVQQVNSLKPDLILLGGDYIGDDKGGAVYGPQASIASFAALRAPMGVLAVLGNHDSRRHALIGHKEWRALFRRIGVTLLTDQAVRRGPLAIGGLRDIYTDHPDVGGLARKMADLGGTPIILSHGPDVFPALPDRPLLTLVGHTHCGQVALPFAGIVYVPSRFGTRYACGAFREGEKSMIVSAGVGTSGLPIRLLSPPDVWLITIRPE
ncbi:metallophosphoesterase [Sphingobium agri]|uniref:Metallophosphoesterase n=1 Tax=Sphingobium agri TaxID=2933566 RepID=A0ABT0DY51_9SPHN|nr:metallophosphoesterase [Sphingobium agri]MCK0531944.1 metallophosphoesterase [Sphingobium agri]